MIKSIDRDSVRRAADQWASHLLDTRSDIDEIVVFGSFENGTWAPGSDLDVLVILAQSALAVRDRIPDLLPTRFPVPLDLFPYTRDELRQREGSPILIAARSSTWRYRRGPR